MGYTSSLQLGDHERVLSIFRETCAAGWNPGFQEGYRSWLVVIAACAVLQRDLARAARLFGAVALAWGTGFYSVAVRVAPMIESYCASAREQLGESARTALWQAGRAMTLEQAITYALDVKVDPDTRGKAGHSEASFG